MKATFYIYLLNHFRFDNVLIYISIFYYWTLSTMRAVSLRSLKSTRSEIGKSHTSSEDGSRKDQDFGDFIKDACKQFDCPVSIAVQKEIQRGK